MSPRVVVAALLAVALLAEPAAGQGRLHPRWETAGRDFRPDGVWRRRARAVTRERHRLLAEGATAELNAPLEGAALAASASAAAAVGGTLAVPAILFSYPGVDSALFMRHPSQYQSVLFGATPPAGLPYSLRSFYSELSNGLLDVAGQTVGWARLDSVESAYTGGRSAACQIYNPIGADNCNGIWSGTAYSRLLTGLREALAKVDPGVDFSQFDNDGSDGFPNSGDDDGVVDVVAFLHATRDGACATSTNGHLWAHRSVVSFSTNDPSARGGTIQVRDYILQSALGGTGGCDTTQSMAIGTMAHELGHGLGLPDLYDASGASQGIGQWGLMGSGNWTTPASPARMEAWSLNELGWITVSPIASGGTVTAGPVATGDTTFLIRAQGANPRGEYFLLENRQAVQADTAMIRTHCQISGSPPGCGGGLLIWHLDSVKASGGAVNAGLPHGVALVQADARGQLDVATGGNRGDAGDPYPGVSGNRAFSVATNPAAVRNVGGGFVGFAVDSIRQLVTGAEMAFRVRFGWPTLVRASDTNAVVVVASDTVRAFHDLLGAGDTIRVAVPDSQVAPDGRTRWRFTAWSDGLPREHVIVGSADGDTVIAQLARDFRVAVAVQGGGTVSAMPGIDLGGTFVAEATPVTLTAGAAAQYVFAGWTGDTTAAAAEVVLPLGRPYSVTARFDSLLAVASAGARPAGLMGAGYADTLRRTGGGPAAQWSVVSGALPPGLTLNAAGRVTGVPAAAGSFRFTARVVSGPQSVEGEFTLSVAAPALSTGAVVAHLVRGSGALTADQLRYLDLLGNRNSVFDVGDFRAWVDATGAPFTDGAAALLRGGAR
jgi:M6 family metalloprotease-like protein